MFNNEIKSTNYEKKLNENTVYSLEKTAKKMCTVKKNYYTAWHKVTEKRDPKHRLL